MLARHGFETAALDAKLLAGHALGLDNLAMAMRDHQPVEEDAAVRLAELMQRRISGLSVARIIGSKEFYGLEFALNAATLEPRPDTELLVDLALARLPPGGRLLDLGTGTGCIPIAILANRADAHGMATDLSAEALEMAGANALRHGVGERLQFRQGNWFAALEGDTPWEPASDERFDLIVSNPPYIASLVIETLAPEVKEFDPRLALDGGEDGLTAYRILAAGAKQHLKPTGSILVEIGFDQGQAVCQLFAQNGFARPAVHKDLGGLDRVLVAHHMGDNHSAV